MTRYLQRLAKKVNMEHYRIQIRVISLHLPASSSLFQHALEGGPTQSANHSISLMGVYFKVKRGNNRMVGKNRYAVYPTAENETTLIDETFEQRSVFFKDSHNDKQFQPKKIGFKLKQEVSKPGPKDKVLGKQTFDIARFVGKEHVIYELNLEGSDTSASSRVTLEISVTKVSDKPDATGGVTTFDHDLVFNDSSEDEEQTKSSAAEESKEPTPEEVELTKALFIRDEISKVEVFMKKQLIELEQKHANVKSDFELYKQLNEYNSKCILNTDSLLVKIKAADVEKLALFRDEKNKEVEAYRERVQLLQQIAEAQKLKVAV